MSPKRPREEENDFGITPAVLRINVGGRVFETTLDTLAGVEYFRALCSFSGNVPGRGPSNEIFIDRCPRLFEIILQALRTFQRPDPHLVHEFGARLINECRYFGINWLEGDVAGNIGTWHLRPRDRILQEQELAGCVRVVGVFADKFEKEPAQHLELPLLFDRRRRPAPQLAASMEVALNRLNEFSKGLVGKLTGIDGIVLAGGAVVNSLVSDVWLGTDLDIFVVGEVGPSNLQRLRLVYEALRSHTLERGKYKTMLVTRTNTSVSVFSSSAEPHKPPPIQIILRVYKDLGELLARFDVDCCACAFDFGSGRFLWTERCRRAFIYGTNVVQSTFDSPSYCHRLEKYASRYNFKVALPGFQRGHVKREALHASYLLVTSVDLMLRVLSSETGTGECTISFGGRRETIAHTMQHCTKLVSNMQRLVLLGSADKTLKISRVATPKPIPCELCQTMSVQQDSLDEAVIVAPVGAPGNYNVFMGASLDHQGSAANNEFQCCEMVEGMRRVWPNGTDNLTGPHLQF